MKTGPKGLALIKKFESLVLTAYKDAVGIWTIGYGHTAAAGSPKPVAGMKITEREANAILARDLVKYEQAVEARLERVPNQNQFDAMVSLCFNIGPTAFAKSSVARFFDAGNDTKAAASFMAWNKAKGKVLKGLTRRRQAEADLFRAKNALGASPVALLSPEVPEPAPAREASPDAPNASGEAVTPASPPDRIKALQKALNERNYDAGKEDGSWGSLTRAAVLACQGNNGLPLNAEAIDLDDVLAAPAWVIESRQDATLKDLRKEGAPTVKRADLVQAAGGTAVAAGAAEKAGLFDQVGEWAEKAGQVKTWIEPFQGGWLESVLTWMAGNFWLLAAIVGGAAAFWFGGRVKARYLDSYKKAETT